MKVVNENIQKLRSLKQVKPLYILPHDPLSDEFLIPAFRVAERVDCMMGFFSSEVLAQLAPGLSTYISCSRKSLRIVISPFLSEADRDAIENSLDFTEEIVGRIFEEVTATESLLEQHTLKCLSWLLREHRLEIKIALMKNGLFHQKVWLFKDLKDVIAAHGSSNMTYSGIGRNVEQVAIACSWVNQYQNYITNKFCVEFNQLWEDRYEGCSVVEIPEAVKQNLLHTFASEVPPAEYDLRSLYAQTSGLSKELILCESDSVKTVNFSIPDCLEYTKGPFKHQGKAVAAWESSGRRGFLAMATGSGKTIAALIAATRLQHEVSSLLVIISAPYKPLVSQWEDEVKRFGVEPLPNRGSSTHRAQSLNQAVLSLKHGLSRVAAMVITENFLTSDSFRKILDNVPRNISTLLIADEAHNLGKRSFLENTPNRFDYRLALSATPERQYDQEGTSHLFAYFGKPVFEFSLRDAIGVCLVPYNYSIHKVTLTNHEFEKWKKLTEALRRKGFEGHDETSESGCIPEDMEKLLFARRRVIESAENKVEALKSLLKGRPFDDVKNVLVYTTDKNPSQIEAVNDMLQNDINFRIHELTSRQTAKPTLCAALLEHFARGDYNALTCMRVLDEGINIPQVREVYILASNTVRRQWIQRRGRVLRKCDAINKQIAHIHDFIVVPPHPCDSSSITILERELERTREFAELSENSSSPGGPFDEIDNLISLYF